MTACPRITVGAVQPEIVPQDGIKAAMKALVVAMQAVKAADWRAADAIQIINAKSMAELTLKHLDKQ